MASCADRPVDVEVLIGADGPKGTAVAERVGDGVFAAGVPNPAAAGRPYALLQFGTVLDDGEDVHSEHVITRAGHGLAVVFHALYERAGADAVAEMPGGREWVAAIEAIPPAERHLVTTKVTWCGSRRWTRRRLRWRPTYFRSSPSAGQRRNCAIGPPSTKRAG